MDDFSGKQHLFIGLFFGLFIFGGEIFRDLTLGIGIAFGSLLPDCDIFGAPASFFCPLWIFFKHRRHVHSILALIIFTILGWMAIGSQFGIGIGFGYLTHLLGDSLTKSRCKYLFYPFHKKKRAAN